MSITGFNRRRRLLKEMQNKEAVDLSKLKVDELKSIAKEKGIEGYSDMKKTILIQAIEGK